MKILITGATGLIGTKLIGKLSEKGHTVHYLSTSKSKIKSAPGTYGYYWNPEKGIIDENCLINVDAIIHLAGATISKRWTPSYKKEILDSRIDSAALLYDTLKKYPHQVQQFVSASATGIYPESNTVAYDETTHEKDNGFLANVVVNWEESAERFRGLGLKVCKIRTGLVLAKEGGALPAMAKPIQYGFGAIMGSGKQVQSWIHVDDLAQLYCFAVENQLDETYNGVAPHPVTYAELTKAIATKLHKPLWLPPIPEWLMRLVLGEMASLLFSGKNISAQKVIRKGFVFQFPTLLSALDDMYQ